MIGIVLVAAVLVLFLSVLVYDEWRESRDDEVPPPVNVVDLTSRAGRKEAKP